MVRQKKESRTKIIWSYFDNILTDFDGFAQVWEEKRTIREGASLFFINPEGLN